MPLGATIEKYPATARITFWSAKAARRAAPEQFASEPERGHHSGELAREVEDQYQGDRGHRDEVARGEEDPPVVVVRHVPDGGDPPEHRADENGAQRDRNPRELDGQPSEHVPNLPIEGAPPRLDVARVPAEESRFFAQRQHDRSEQLRSSEQLPELLLPGCQ